MARHLLLLAAALAVLAQTAAAQPATKPTTAPATRPATSQGATIRLFNGRDLEGWTWYTPDGQVPVGDVWSVVDGNLRCKGTPAGYLRTDAEYESFVLKLQVRYIRPGNGGVLMRIIGPDRIWPQCIEAQGQSGNLGDIYNIGFDMQADPKRTRGRLTQRLHPNVPEKPQGEWNDYEIHLDGPRLMLIVNGVVQNQVDGCRVVPGRIGLQSEGGEYEFRNITLTTLPGRE